MPYGGRYADYDDEPSRRQPTRDERNYQSRYDDIPSTPTQRSLAPDDPSRQSIRDVPIPFRSNPPPGLGPPGTQPRTLPQEQSSSTRGGGYPLSPPTEAFSTLSVSVRPDPSIDGRVQQSEVSHLRGMEAVERRLTQLKPSPFAVRPGHGTSGKALQVKTNYFQVRPWNGETPKIIHHYDVEIDPHVRVANQKKPKALLRAVWEQLVLEQKDELWVGPFAASAFDGRKNAYTPIEFPMGRDNTQSFSVAVNTDGVVQKPGQSSGSEDEQRRWKIVIKHVALIDLEAVIRFCKADQGSAKVEEECLTALMATNVLLRDVPSKKYAQVGAAGNRFFSSEGAVPIAHGAVVCKGFMQSFRYSSCGLPVLNLDVGYSAFLASGPAIDVIAKIIGMPATRARGGYTGGIQPKRELLEMNERDIARAKSKLRGAKFTVTHRKSSRLHTVQSITLMSAEKIFFALNGKDGQADRRVSICEYFEEFHGSTVTKPRLPCIQYGKKAYVPLEFVELTEWNSLPPLKLSPDQTAEMIKISAVKPPDRCNQIVKWRQELAYEQQDKIRQWGLQINKQLMKVPARILPAPSVMYARGQDARPTDGSWNLRGKEFFRNGQAPLKAWSIISFDRFTNVDEMKRYVIYLMQTLERHGVKIENKQPTLIGPVDPTQEKNVKSALQSAARAAYQAGQCAPQLILIMLPGRDAFLYEQIKRLSFMDLKAPVPTQCMQAAKIRAPRSIEAYTGNLVMKVQAKLGGVTHQVPLKDLPGMVRGKTMLLGGNLGFPPTRFGQFEGAPTVACTIATYNADCDAYSAQIRLQEGRSEFIFDLASMIHAHLTIFAKHNNGTYPDRILIFRDGISEGQYAPVLAYENDAVIRACAKIQVGYRPKILICVCAKRHSTRFFGDQYDIDVSGNLHAGLVVDQGVTHPYAFDFFMQSHQGRVGTARPTHYVCLLDEIGVSPDELQRMVHSLCYTFPRCTKSVSLVPVCYIADLVCQKARIIVHEPNPANSAPSESSHGGTNTTRSMFRRPGGELDVMQVQRVLEKNKELELVGWWM